jgi:hypothetical protein
MAQHNIILNYLHGLRQETEHDINNAMILNSLWLKDSIDPKSEIERRSIGIVVGTDDKITATSFKLYNSLLFSQSEFSINILKSLGSIGGFISGTPIGTILGILGIIGSFLDVSRKEFNEQEARVLLTIYRLGKICHISTIAEEYEISFGRPIDKYKLNASLQILSRFRTIEICDDEVEIIEQVNIIR